MGTVSTLQEIWVFRCKTTLSPPQVLDVVGRFVKILVGVGNPLGL
jgi:hypothetical protein